MHRLVVSIDGKTREEVLEAAPNLERRYVLM